MPFPTRDKFVATAAREMIGAATRAVGRPILRAGSADFHFPDDTELIALSFEALSAASVRIVRSSADADVVATIDGGTVYVTAGLRLGDVSRVYLTCSGDAAATGSVTLDLAYLGRRFTSPPMLIEWPAGKGEHQILAFDSDGTDRRKELVAHLNAHRAHYSQAVYRALDSGTIVAMLGEYTWKGRPLIDQVEPQPLTMAGNYLVFRAPVELEDSSGVSEAGQVKTWGTLLKDRAITPGRQSADDRLIPLPTAGVFAEAVLGRSNSAEKLDVTRFWNWQDSPIPLTPTEIAAVGTGSRATAEDLKPGQLGQPVLNIVNPPALPNPTGIGAVLGTVASGHMFRDMSGLAGTQKLVQAGMQETLQAATDAGQLASANLRTEAQKAVAMGQIAADIVKSVMGGGGGSSSAAQSLSGAGAMINHGKSMDQTAASSANAGSGGLEPGFTGTNHQEAFDSAVWGQLGTSGTGAAAETLAQVLGLQNVGDHYVPPATNPTHPRSFELPAMAGEQILAKTLESEGMIVFRDWTKNVSAKGIDLVALDPKTGTVWLIDNKAQFASDISGANALTGKSFGTYLEETKAFLKNTSPHPRAAEALAAIEKGNYIKVVGNAWAKATRRFTPGLFAKKLYVYDVRLRRLFGDHASWDAAFSAFVKLRGVRRLRGVRGAATIDGMLMVLVVSGSALYALRSGEDMKTMLGELVAESALGAILSRLPGGFIAGAALNLKSDRSAAGQAAYERDETINAILASVPEYLKATEAEQKQAREEIGKMLDEPMTIDPPPTAPAAPTPSTPAPTPLAPSNQDSGGGPGTPLPPGGPPGWGGGSA